MKSEDDEAKVQLAGGGSYTITLPKWWCTKNKIWPGEKLSRYSTRNSVVISRKLKDKNRNINIFLDTLEYPDEKAYLQQILIASYIAGFGTITLLTEKEKTDEKYINGARWLDKRAQGAIHFVRESNKKTVISIKTDQEKLQPTLMSMYQDINFMIEEIKNEFQSQNVEGQINEIEEYDNSLDKTQWLIHRLTSQILTNSNVVQTTETAPSLMIQSYQVARLLEKVGDDIVSISKELKTFRKKCADSHISFSTTESLTTALLDKAKNLLKGGIDAYIMILPDEELVKKYRDDLSSIQLNQFDAKQIDEIHTEAVKWMKRDSILESELASDRKKYYETVDSQFFTFIEKAKTTATKKIEEAEQTAKSHDINIERIKKPKSINNEINENIRKYWKATEDANRYLIKKIYKGQKDRIEKIAIGKAHMVVADLIDLNQDCNILIEKMLLEIQKGDVVVPLITVADCIRQIGIVSKDISMITINSIFKNEMEMNI